MTESLGRLLARDFPIDAGTAIDAQQFSARDASMSRTFEFLMARLPARSKVVVWTATVHSARDLGRVPGREQSRSLGPSSRATTAIGCSRWGFPPTPARSRGPASRRRAYRIRRRRSKRRRSADHTRICATWRSTSSPGSVPSRRACWAPALSRRLDRIFDGVVVLREERPPAPPASAARPVTRQRMFDPSHLQQERGARGRRRDRGAAGHDRSG